ncbi:MAG: periplasmic heavy metal sensor [Candidatus Eisenbacteria sp.]|nr:periplasmic heavy metal sensor [Candidatus Eisenbacteria bacterium]
MRRGWFVLLALSLGLNAGLFYTTLATRSSDDLAPAPPPMVGPPVAVPGHPGPGMDPPGAPAVEQMIRGRHERMCRFLVLGDDQRRQTRTILDAALPRIVALREDVHEIRRLIHDAYRQPEIDAPHIRGLVERLTAAQARLDSLAAETMLQEVALLTPEQRVAYWRAMPFGLPPQPAGCGRHGLRHHKP